MNQTDELAFSRALVALFKDVVYKDAAPAHWQTVVEQKNRIEDYVNKIGLTLIVDDVDGYSFLKQRFYGDNSEDIPRLIPRHALSYPVSLLIVLLRKQLLEFDSTTGDARLVLSREQIIERMRLFLKETTNEAKLMDGIDKHIEKVREMGFIRRLRGSENAYEVQRVLRSFANAEWLNQFDELLASYYSHANNGKEKEATDEAD
jgi:hypothetical protein